MALSNYTELQASIGTWMNRSDLSAIIPDFVRLFEARANRELRVTDMEEALSSTPLVSGGASLPTGFLAFKELRFDGTPNYTLQPKSLEWIRGQIANSTSTAQYFAVTKSTVQCWPETGPIKGTYYKEIPALASNSTNWLLTSYPDLYLFGSLVEAAIYLQDDASLAKFAPRVVALLDDVQKADDRNQFDGGILAVRAQ